MINQDDKYEQSLISYRDMKSVLETAVEDGKIKIARNLLNSNLSDEEIAQYTNLTVEIIMNLRKEIKK
jgi:hypothetical protein